MKFWVFELIGYCWILFEWFLGFLNLFNGLFLEPRWKWRLRRKLQIEILDFFVFGFCWLMRFWLIYEVLGVWVDGLLLDFVWMISGFLESIQWPFSWTSPKMKASAEVADRRELKIRERREMGEKRYNFRIYYFNE